MNNPNLVLSNALEGKNIVSTTTLRISTTPLNPPTSGGGTDNIAFLQGAAGGPNAQAAKSMPSSGSKRSRNRTARSGTSCSTRRRCC